MLHIPNYAQKIQLVARISRAGTVHPGKEGGPVGCELTHLSMGRSPIIQTPRLPQGMQVITSVPNLYTCLHGKSQIHPKPERTHEALGTKANSAAQLRSAFTVRFQSRGVHRCRLVMDCEGC